jgi:CBS domain-containing protein
VSAVLESDETPSWRVQEDRPITELLSSEMLGRLGALPAVDAEGILRGVVTVDQVRRALRSAATQSMA